jgi:hypothetical protein
LPRMVPIMTVSLQVEPLHFVQPALAECSFPEVASATGENGAKRIGNSDKNAITARVSQEPILVCFRRIGRGTSFQCLPGGCFLFPLAQREHAAKPESHRAGTQRLTAEKTSTQAEAVYPHINKRSSDRLRHRQTLPHAYSSPLQGILNSRKGAAAPLPSRVCASLRSTSPLRSEVDKPLTSFTPL